MGMTLCKLKATFPVKFLEKGSTSGYSMIIAKAFESSFELSNINVKLEVSDDGHDR